MPAEAAGAPVHLFRLRVYYEDTDAAGIVYYANYLRFAERARTEYLRDAGVDQRTLRDRDGLLFAVRRCEIDYLLPARLDDSLEVMSRVVALQGASVTMQQTVMRAAEILAQLSVRVACVDGAGRPARMPGWLRGRMSAGTSAGGVGAGGVGEGSG
ncbi:MAG: tol-pal system-associated acyl-CoA thioesterase [Alphaproteobacteria bacterium]